MEKKILSIVSEFEKETEAVVRGIDVNRIFTVGGVRYGILTETTARIEIE